MDTSFYYSDSNLFNYQNNTITKRTQETFQALVNAIIPRTPGLAYEYGAIQYYGALDLKIDEYVILTLNSLYIPLAELTADLLNFVAKTMMGYYSEWSGYGTTRLANPNNRILEHDPLSWKQVGYPGPSLGYRALRTYNFT